jgi:hypothetical protein
MNKEISTKEADLELKKIQLRLTDITRACMVIPPQQTQRMRTVIQETRDFLSEVYNL